MPILLLTRPKSDSERFLAAVERELGPVEHLISPVMEIVPLNPEVPSAINHLVFTSAHGVLQAKRLGIEIDGHAFCVGDRTAEVARAHGYAAFSASGDAPALIQNIIHEAPSGALCHVRGVHSRGQVAANLITAGFPCREIVAYDQVECAPSLEALETLSGAKPVILPLFSPRSAVLLPAITQAPVHVIAMSQAVAAEVAELEVDTVSVAESPTFEGMLAATCRHYQRN